MDNLEPVDYIRQPDRHLDEIQRRWLQPPGLVMRIRRRMLFGVNWLFMRLVFRLQVTGSHKIPQEVPFIITPNHTSSLDPAALAAALPYRVLSHTRWAGRKGAVLRNPCRRGINRLAGTVPVELETSALAIASAVLQQMENLVWFPEGTRTSDGNLQQFQPGIGLLLVHLSLPAIPVYRAGLLCAPARCDSAQACYQKSRAYWRTSPCRSPT